MVEVDPSVSAAEDQLSLAAELQLGCLLAGPFLFAMPLCTR
jgi:hypothetical protein